MFLAYNLDSIVSIIDMRTNAYTYAARLAIERVWMTN